MQEQRVYKSFALSLSKKEKEKPKYVYLQICILFLTTLNYSKNCREFNNRIWYRWTKKYYYMSKK